MKNAVSYSKVGKVTNESQENREARYRLALAARVRVYVARMCACAHVRENTRHARTMVRRTGVYSLLRAYIVLNEANQKNVFLMNYGNS